MPCHHVRVGLVDGQPVSAIVCTGKPRRKRCKNCGAMTKDHRLCDWKIGDGKTCDAPLCVNCTNIPAPNKDLCDKHAEEWKKHTKKFPVPITS